MLVLGNESGYTTPVVRPIRIEYEGAVYPVTVRGNDRKAIFKTDKDREQFIELKLRSATKKGSVLGFQCSLHVTEAYA